GRCARDWKATERARRCAGCRRRPARESSVAYSARPSSPASYGEDRRQPPQVQIGQQRPCAGCTKKQSPGLGAISRPERVRCAMEKETRGRETRRAAARVPGRLDANIVEVGIELVIGALGDAPRVHMST